MSIIQPLRAKKTEIKSLGEAANRCVLKIQEVYEVERNRQPTDPCECDLQTLFSLRGDSEKILNVVQQLSKNLDELDNDYISYETLTLGSGNYERQVKNILIKLDKAIRSLNTQLTDIQVKLEEITALQDAVQTWGKIDGLLTSLGV